MGRFGAAAGWHVAPVALLSPCHICACWCTLVPGTLAVKWVRVLLEGTLTVLWVLFGGPRLYHGSRCPLGGTVPMSPRVTPPSIPRAP